MNLINWKASAKTGQLMVNQYNETTSPSVCILLNLESEGMLRYDVIFINNIYAPFTAFYRYPSSYFLIHHQRKNIIAVRFVRQYVTPEDVKKLAVSVFAHRLVLKHGMTRYASGNFFLLVTISTNSNVSPRTIWSTENLG